VLRRRASGGTATPDGAQPNLAADPAGKLVGKGKPTPKRSDVERARRQPYNAPPADKKAAAAQDRTRRRAEQQRRTEAMKRGEEWAIPPRDRGPMRSLARDYVDSRRFLVSEYILFGVFVLIFALFALDHSKKSDLLLYIELAIVGVIVIESLYHGLRFKRAASQVLPGVSTRGSTWYITKRMLRLRASRIPPARVQRGQDDF
jgi:hypothetical protein